MNPTEDFSNSIEEAIKHPKNLGELDGADAVGTVIAVASVATELIPGKTVEEALMCTTSRGSAQVCASAGCACTRTEEWRADIAAAAASAGARIKENSFKAFK